jgi:hypothetical protein
MGMPVDPVPAWPVDRVCEMTGEHDVEYLAAPHDVLLAGEATPSPLVPRTILRIGGRYLVEPVDEPDTWYMGERTGGGVESGAWTSRWPSSTSVPDWACSPQAWRSSTWPGS